MKFIDELKNLFTTSSPEGLNQWVSQVDVNDVWLIDYLSSNEKTMEVAVKLNRYVGWLDKNAYRTLAYLLVPKTNDFHWNSGYIRKDSKKESQLEENIKRLYHWSEVEWAKNINILSIPEVNKYYKERWKL